MARSALSPTISIIRTCVQSLDDVNKTIEFDQSDGFRYQWMVSQTPVHHWNGEVNMDFLSLRQNIWKACISAGRFND